MKRLTDINGVELDVGDLVVTASQGNIEKSYLLGVTEGGFYVSTCKNKYKQVKHWTDYRDPEKHDSKKYQYRYRDILLVQKNKQLPKMLLKVCNINQLNSNG